MSSIISSAHRKAALAVAALVAGMLKASVIDGLVRGYVDDLTRNFLDVLDGKLSTPTAVKLHHSFLEQLAERAYDAGMTDGGADPADKDAADEAAVADWTAGEDGHVADLWADVKQLRADKKNLSPEDYAARQLTINDRLAQWGESLRNLYSLAKANAKRKVMGTWKLGQTEQHCQTHGDTMGCAQLNGQRHRLGWFLDNGYIPQENGSETLTCGGWKCECTIQDDSGKVLMP